MRKIFISMLFFYTVSSWAFKEVKTKVVKHGEIVSLEVDVKGLKTLFLVATDGGDTNGSDHAVWGNPVYIDGKGNEKSATDLRITKKKVGYGRLSKNKTNNGKPLSIAGKKMKNGFFAHANSVIGLKLPRGTKTFKVQVGIQDGATAGSVCFTVTSKVKPQIIPVPIKLESVRLAIKDLMRRFRRKYPNGKQHLATLAKIEKMKKGAKKDQALRDLQRKALLENPLLKQFSKIIAVRRKYGDKARSVIHTATTNFNAYSLEKVNVNSGKDNLVTLSGFSNDQTKMSNLYTPPKGGHIAEIDLHFSAKKLMFSGKGDDNQWHLLEVDTQGEFIRQITPSGVPYNSFDSCYLPNGKIVYTSTAPMQGLPCESGRVRMANSYLIDPETKKIRRLTFDQDTNWGLTMMEDGRVLYLRWEYSDTAHMFSRILMTMNPDGSQQKQFYGSNSYWPNTISTPKPIPGSSSKFIGVISGHHVGRPGPICLFDTRLGTFEADGAIQMIPGYGKKVVPEIKDHLYGGLFPKFQNPIPLGKSEKEGAMTYFVASCKPTKTSLWGIYLVDIFENYVLISEEEDYAMGEPIPFIPTKRPSIIPDRVKANDKEATVYIANIYEGPGLKNIPIGTVTDLKLFTYHYSYYHAGSHESVGVESSWDIKRLLGTVPVNSDGSVMFKVPANTPISIQPVDKNGSALQLMQSWFTAMPGETLACIGCHESPNMVVPVSRNIASTKPASTIQNNFETERNFSFLKEVQPVLSRNCISCHNPDTKLTLPDGKTLPDFKTLTLTTVDYPNKIGRGDETWKGGPFSLSYLNLNPYTSRPGPESDYHLKNPMEYHTSNSRLIQILNSGHHGVKLTDPEMRKLKTWIDLNVPFWGSWTDAHRDWANVTLRNWSGSGSSNEAQLCNIKKNQKIRNRLQKEYANITADFETDQYSLNDAVKDILLIKPKKHADVSTPKVPKLAGWPFEAKSEKSKTVKINGLAVDFVRIPTGSFVMGSKLYQDSAPKVAKVTRPFWMAKKETSNKLFTMFKKDHDSGFMDQHGKDHTTPGMEAKTPSLPVIRVSFNEAVAFTRWLTVKTGKKFRLPTEVEWEFAARAGTDSDFYWGTAKDDFSGYANLADKAIEKFVWRSTHNYRLRVKEFNDKAQVQTKSGAYKPNAFGLYDMIGNVGEWTSTRYKKSSRVITKGGSWSDLPRFMPVGAKVPFERYQRVFNVGIRLVIEE